MVKDRIFMVLRTMVQNHLKPSWDYVQDTSPKPSKTVLGPWQGNSFSWVLRTRSKTDLSRLETMVGDQIFMVLRTMVQVCLKPS
jgi:hypothetical protein